MTNKITNYKISYKPILILFVLSIFTYFGCTPKVVENASSTETVIKEEIKDIAEIADTTPSPTKMVEIKERKFILNEAVPLDPNVRIGTLSNGMKYYITDDNDMAPMSWYDLFESRFFSSYITKRSNSLDLRIIDQFEGYEQAGVDRLIESNKIKMELFNLEHDLWTY